MTAQFSRLSDSILIGHIQTRLAGATVVEPSTPSRTARKALESRNFDQAPVMEGGVPIGFVRTTDLSDGRGNVSGYVQPILPRAIASETAPLEDALPWLEDTGFLFLLRGQTITGFVVPSDLNKQAGRGYIYIALTELELRLADLVRELSRECDTLDCLAPQQASAIRKKMRLRVASNVEADVVAEMNLSHLFKIVGSKADLLDGMHIGTHDEWEEVWRPINDLRTRIAHSAKPLLEVDYGVGALRTVSDKIHRLIGRLEARNPQNS